MERAYKVPAMEAKLQQVLAALTVGGQVQWSAERPPTGAEPGPRELFISVGSRSNSLPPHPRMLAWKLPQWVQRSVRSSTVAVLHSAAELDALAEELRRPGHEGPHTPLSLRFHEPTLDVVCAVLLLMYRLLHREWPAVAEALSEYVSEWEQGHTESAGDYERGLGPVFYAALRLWPPQQGRPSPELLELMVRLLGAAHTLAELEALPRHVIPQSVTQRLKADEQLYRAELSRAWRVQLDLPLSEEPGAPVRRVDALFLSSFQNVIVHKLLARSDTENTHYGQGFEFMAVHVPREEGKAWHTFSMTPGRAGTLADLAAYMDRLEGDKQPDGAPRARGTPRFERQPNDYNDPWYSNGYASADGRCTLVAPPHAGTRLSRRELWEAIWSRFNVGRSIHVLQAHTIYARPFMWRKAQPEKVLQSLGFRPCHFSGQGTAFHPAVAQSFLGNSAEADVAHFAHPSRGDLVRVSVYPNQLVVVWIERHRAEETTLYALAQQQAALAGGKELWDLQPLVKLTPWLEPLGLERWLVYGAYRISRARSSMLDDSRSVQGLFHALASGTPPLLERLPSEAAAASRRVLREAAGETEHWLTPMGGARLELLLEEEERGQLTCDPDFLLFLLTTGQRYSVFEISRRMAEVEQRARTSRWSRLGPARDVRSDVMLFTNSLWHSRVGEEPDFNARYLAWHSLHGLRETVDAMRDQAAELDQYKRDQFDGMVSLLVFVFLPVSLACGFFSGAQFQDMPASAGLPWSTTGWLIFLGYTAFFTVLVVGTMVFARLRGWRRR